MNDKDDTAAALARLADATERTADAVRELSKTTAKLAAAMTQPHISTKALALHLDKAEKNLRRPIR